MLNSELIRRQDQSLSVAAGPAIGQVISVRGSQVTVGLSKVPGRDQVSVRATVGKFLGIRTGESLLVGVITKVLVEALLSKEHGWHSTADVDLVGEIKRSGSSLQFQRGVSDYPAIGDSASAIGPRELKLVYNVTSAAAVEIGHLQQDSTITAYVDIDDTLCKHFAILGTTGVGKSSAVVLLLQEIIRARPNVRILVLDAHNEYGRPFADRAVVLNPANLRLPFWLFNFEEMVDVLFGARPGSEEEVAILSEVIPRAKIAYNLYRASTDRSIMRKGEPRTIGYSVDTPVPYRLADLIGLLDERMGKLENRSSRMTYHRLITRIEGVCNDPRYSFMFDNANVGGDTMAEVLSELFSRPTASRSPSCNWPASRPRWWTRSYQSSVAWLSTWGFGARAQPRCCSCARRRTGTPPPTAASGSGRHGDPSLASRRKAASMGFFSAWSVNGRLSSTPPSSPNAAHCSPCA